MATEVLRLSGRDSQGNVVNRDLNITVNVPATTNTKPLVGVGGGPLTQHFTWLESAPGNVGKMLVRRSYGGGIPTSFSSSEMASDYAAGRASVWSFKPNMTTFATDTTAQTAFSNFLNQIPADHVAYIICWHEPEDDIYDGDFTIQQYGAVQNKCADIVNSKNRPNLKFGPCFMSAWTFDSRNTSYFPYASQWGTVMDWNKFGFIGVDFYRTKVETKYSMEAMWTIPNSGDGSSTNTKSAVAWLRSYSPNKKLPFIMCETGMYTKPQPTNHGQYDVPVSDHTEAEIVRWMNESWAFYKEWNVDNPQEPWLAVCWYNYSLIGAECPIDRPMSQLQTSEPQKIVYPLKVAAWKNIVADSKVA